MRRIKTAVATLAVMCAAAVPALAASKSITVGDDYFIKRGGGTVTVKKGTTVKWVFRGENQHTVNGSGAGSFINSGRPRDSGTYALKIKRKGTFKIICTIHSGQRMTLKVT